MNHILSVIGLFLPIKNRWYEIDGGKVANPEEWEFSLAVGKVPLGWIIVATALAVHFIF